MYLSFTWGGEDKVPRLGTIQDANNIVFIVPVSASEKQTNISSVNFLVAINKWSISLTCRLSVRFSIDITSVVHTGRMLSIFLYFSLNQTT